MLVILQHVKLLKPKGKIMEYLSMILYYLAFLAVVMATGAAIIFFKSFRDQYSFLMSLSPEERRKYLDEKEREKAGDN